TAMPATRRDFFPPCNASRTARFEFYPVDCRATLPCNSAQRHPTTPLTGIMTGTVLMGPKEDESQDAAKLKLFFTRKNAPDCCDT
ncbi:MAG: hypothetical protein AAFR23_03110, partial [Pseudomonadota bacterium]